MTVTLDHIYEAAPDAKMMSKGYLLMTCPWHDDAKQSLLVYPDGWVCMGECNTTGSLDKLYSELNKPGSTRRSATDKFAGRPPRVPSRPDKLAEFIWAAHDTIKRNTSHRWYLRQRGVEDRIETCKLGWHEGWVVVPVFSRDGEVVGAYLRAGPQAERVTGLRFTQPVGQKPMMYVPEWPLLRDTTRPLAVVYGMFDALSLSELRIPVATTIGGATSFDANWLAFWPNRVILLPDRGEEDIARELSAGLGWKGRVKYLDYPEDCDDPADYLQTGKRKQLLAELAPEFM